MAKASLIRALALAAVASWSAPSGPEATASGLAQRGPQAIASGSALSHAQATALAKALLAHDDSVVSLRWTQVVHLNAGRLDELPQHTSQIFDQQRWKCVFQKTGTIDQGGEVVTLEGEMSYDGVLLRGRDDSSQTGVIREYAGERRSEVGVDCWLGRHLDIQGGRRLGELLLRSPDLRVDGASERGLPILRASAELAPLLAELEVEVDPSHGWAPRTLTVRDLAIRVPYYKYEVLEFVSTSGVWLPKRGVLTTRRFDPTAAQSVGLMESLSRSGCSQQSDPRDPKVRAVYAAALREIFGADEAQSSPLVPPMTMEVIELELNPDLHAEDFIVEYPQTYAVLDAIRGLIRKPGESEWTENPTGK